MALVEGTAPSMQHESREGRLERLSGRFNRMVGQARLALFAERLWPRLVPTLYTGGFFLTASWAGLWHVLPHQARMAGVLAMGAAALAAPFLVREKSLRVTRDEAIDRLDDNIGDPSRPARKISDTLHESYSALSKGLWQIHLEKLWDKNEGRFFAGKPEINWAGLQGYGLAAALAITLGSGIYAGESRHANLMQAFNWAAPIPPLELKAWVVPPEGIESRPLYLTQDNNGQAAPLVTHENSILTIHIYDTPARVLVNGTEVGVLKELESDNGKTYMREIELSGTAATVTIENGPQWQFTVTPDLNPTISATIVKGQEKGDPSMSLNYEASDDFGIKGGKVILSLPAGTADPGARPLPAGQLPVLALPR